MEFLCTYIEQKNMIHMKKKRIMMFSKLVLRNDRLNSSSNIQSLPQIPAPDYQTNVTAPQTMTQQNDTYTATPICPIFPAMQKLQGENKEKII